MKMSEQLPLKLYPFTIHTVISQNKAGFEDDKHIISVSTSINVCCDPCDPPQLVLHNIGSQQMFLFSKSTVTSVI